MPAGLIDEQRSEYAPGAIWVAISARCRFMALVSHRGKTRSRALAVLGADCAEYISGGGS